MKTAHFIKDLKEFSRNKKGLTLSNTKGFTLIELLVVIGILAILLAITLIAINPAHQFAQARDTQRKSDINTVLNGVDQYLSEKGTLPPSMAAMTTDGTEYEVAKATDMTGKVDLCSDLVTTYVADLPHDPRQNSSYPTAGCAGVDYDTGYKISINGTDNRATVYATADDGTTILQVTR